MTRSLTLGLLTSFVLVTAACASAPDDGSSVESAVATANVCATLDYGPVAPASEYYRYLDDPADREAYLKALAADGTLSGTYDGITDDARLNALVTDVYEGFKKVFPHETRDLPEAAPRIALVGSPEINAFALGPVASDGGRSPWIFFVNTGVLERDLSDTALRGVFAHELGHLILRTFLPEIKQRVRTSYLVHGSEDGVLGAVQPDDDAVAAHIEALLQHQERVTGLGQLGFGTLLDASYMKAARATFDHAERTGPAGRCAAATERINELMAAQVAFIPRSGEGLFVPIEPTPDQVADLEAKTEAFKAELLRCTAGLPPMSPASLAEMTALVAQMPVEAAQPSHPLHADLLASMLDLEKTIDAEAGGASLIERVMQAEKPLRSEVVKLRANPAFPIDQLRTFDYEEDADDAAVRVLAAIGDDPTGVGHFFLDAMLTPEKKAACIADVEAGRVVPYGQLLDPHPGTCWRYYHTVQFSKALARCDGPSRLAKRQPLGHGRASIRDHAKEPLGPNGALAR